MCSRLGSLGLNSVADFAGLAMLGTCLSFIESWLMRMVNPSRSVVTIGGCESYPSKWLTLGVLCVFLGLPSLTG